MGAGTYTLVLTVYFHAPLSLVMGDPGSASDWALFGDFTDVFGQSRGHLFAVDITSSSGVPEPATLLLIGSGLLGFGLLRRRFR